MGLFIDAFTLFLRSPFGLAVPDWVLGLEIPSSSTHTLTAISNYHMHEEIATQIHVHLDHINSTYSRGPDGLADPELFCLKQLLF
jgi:hypothetical protein